MVKTMFIQNTILINNNSAMYFDFEIYQNKYLKHSIYPDTMSFVIEQTHAKTWYDRERIKLLLKDYTMSEIITGILSKLIKARTTDTWIWIVPSCSNNVCRRRPVLFFLNDATIHIGKNLKWGYKCLFSNNKKAPFSGVFFVSISYFLRIFAILR